MKKTLSIIIPVYDSEATVGRAMDSLKTLSAGSRDQTEVIVIDDGSSDRSAEVIATKRDGLEGLDLIVIRQENRGSSAARNTGIRSSGGEWIFFLDADDELATDIVPYLRDAGDATAACFSVSYMKDGRPAGELRPAWPKGVSLLDFLTSCNPYAISSLAFRRDSMGPLFDEDFAYLEDWLFWFENRSIFSRVKVFPLVTSAVIHAHGRNKTADRRRNGISRSAVAEKLLAELGDALTLKQRNNLMVQSGIGMLQQGKSLPYRTFLRVPCSGFLYMKLVVYFLLRGNVARIDRY